ncbi:MAG: hypothetical protein JW395_3529 [Nitrospira sp.]|nr:hypothetical protein [Nitrospira sp.]
MVVAKDLHRDWPDLSLLCGFSTDVPNRHNRYHDFLRHSATVEKPCTTREVKQVRPLGNPELRVTLGSSSHADSAVPHGRMAAQVVSDQVPLLADNSALGGSLKLALVNFCFGCFRKKKPVVGCHQNVMTIQIVHDMANEGRDFVDRTADAVERIALGLPAVSSGVHSVVVDVHHPFVLDELAALGLLLGHQVVVLAGHPADQAKNTVPLLERGGDSIDKHVFSFVGQRLVRQQAGHSKNRV